MQYGFLLDQNRCIGCHACTVACKAENDVALGNFRTWVKAVEVGRFPAVRRAFAVLRCNHCSRPPCVAICPVSALEKREDGIVDLDREACIGCRACMQACPYDAIALDERTGAADKCHFCAHRLDRGLEPACVVVCPEQAIVSGDLEDADGELARRVAAESTQVRRPERDTGPNVHYVGHEPIALRPGAAVEPATFLWTERPPGRAEAWPVDLAERADARLVLDTGHPPVWGGAVAAYLVTKGIAAGAMLLAPLFAMLAPSRWSARLLPEAIALAFLSVTALLLVLDLSRPRLFLRLLLKPNPRSWLVRGAWVLTAAGLLAAASLAAGLAGADPLQRGLRAAGVPAGALAAAYTAWLFRQCEGRDLWRTPALLPHLLIQALLLGATLLAPLAAVPRPLALLAAAAAVAHAAVVLLEGQGRRRSANEHQARAVLAALRVGPFPAVTAGWILVLLGAVAGLFLSPFLAPLPVVIGVAMHEWAFVKAAQVPPLS